MNMIFLQFSTLNVADTDTIIIKPMQKPNNCNKKIYFFLFVCFFVFVVLILICGPNSADFENENNAFQISAAKFGTSNKMRWSLYELS